MMFPFREWFRALFNRRGGGILEGMSLLSIVAIISMALASLSIYFSRSALRKVMNTRAPVQNTSVAETVLLAYRSAQAKYVRYVVDQGCVTPNPFLVALKSGSNCSGSTVVVFTGNDSGTAETPPLYTFSGSGCSINRLSSTCASGSIAILRTVIPNQAQLYTRALASTQTPEISFDVNLVAVRPETSLAEFSAVSSVPGVNSRFGFAIRDGLPNSAHLDSGVHPDYSTNLVQMNPDSGATCPGSAGASYLVYAPPTGCVSFPHTQTSYGLAYYENGYFGLHNYSATGEGQIVDLRTGDPVAANGTAGGATQVFPAYSPELLSNVDDIAVIEDQVYYIGYQGSDTVNVGNAVPIPSVSNLSTTQIGVLKGTGATATRQIICDLGAQGWGMHFNGLAAASWNDPMVPGQNAVGDRMSVFYAKSDTGQIVTAIALLPQGASQYTCSTFLDPNLQNPDFVRTNGFDRTPDSKPYYLF